MLKFFYAAGTCALASHIALDDPYLFTLAQWLEGDGVSIDSVPKILDHRNRMAERPAVKRALAQELRAG